MRLTNKELAWLGGLLAVAITGCSIWASAITGSPELGRKRHVDCEQCTLEAGWIYVPEDGIDQEYCPGE